MKRLILFIATIWFSLGLAFDVYAQRKGQATPRTNANKPRTRDVPAQKTEASDPISGDWNGTVSFGGKNRPLGLKLKLEAGKVSGELLIDDVTLKVAEGSWAGNKLSLAIEPASTTPTSGTLTLTGTLLGGKLAGEFELKNKKDDSKVMLTWEAWRKSERPDQSVGVQPRPTKQGGVKEYKQGETYTLGDVVNLNAEGNKLVVEMESKGDSIEFKVKILGKPSAWSYKLGGEWDFTLTADQKRIAPSSASQTDEVVSTYAAPALTTNFTVVAKDGGVVYFKDTTHPLLLRFDVPDEVSKATKQLELKGMRIGGQDYSLTFSVKK